MATKRAPARKAAQGGKKQGDANAVSGGRHPVEWAVGALSGVLVLVLLAYLAWSAFAAGDAPPRFRTTVERVAAVDDGFHALVAVANTGDGTAADVAVAGVLSAGGDEEAGGFRIDYLPAGSTRRGTVVFKRDPRQGELRIAITGYSEP